MKSKDDKNEDGSDQERELLDWTLMCKWEEGLRQFVCGRIGCSLICFLILF